MYEITRVRHHLKDGRVGLQVAFFWFLIKPANTRDILPEPKHEDSVPQWLSNKQDSEVLWSIVPSPS